jgi:hypothetical protein
MDALFRLHDTRGEDGRDGQDACMILCVRRMKPFFFRMQTQMMEGADRKRKNGMEMNRSDDFLFFRF